VSGGARQNAADTKSAPVNEDETPSDAAEIRALAEEAEVEAAEAEALAAAARARARAMQLRRQAERIEAKKEEAPKEEAPEAAAEEAAEEEAGPAEEDVAADPVEVEVPDTSEPEETEAEADSAETEEPAAEAEAKAKVAETDDDAAPAEAEPPPGRFSSVTRRLRRPKWSTVLASLAIVIILASVAGSIYMIKEHHDAVQRRQHEAEFLAAARQGVVTLTSLDFNEAKEGVQRILDNSTGSFKDDFIKMADDFTKVVQQSKVISQGTVKAAAVESMTKDSAVVLVASTSEITNAAGAKQEPRNYRLIVTVAREGAQLKISKVEFAP
jgi:Mce-associated membrane protein